MAAKNSARKQASGLPPIKLRIESSSTAVRRALSEISRALGPLNLGAEDKGTLELVLAEVLNNIVEHAHAEGPGGIEIRCDQAADSLHLTITDDGTGMPGGKVPPGRLKPIDPDNLPEGGFGWFLINRLAKDVRYARHDGKNSLSFRLALRSGS